MPNEKEYFQNPGPWHMYPGSNHVVDADGNTVCTIAPDCSKAAINIINNAPETVKLLGEITNGLYALGNSEAHMTQEDIAGLAAKMEEITVFMEQIKSMSHE